MIRLLFAVVLTAVVSSGITTVIVHSADSAVIVSELQRQDRERKADEADAEHWATDAGKPLFPAKN